MIIEILPLPDDKKKPKYQDDKTLGFGRVFTDRMFIAEWIEGQGWTQARIQPYAPFVLDPSCLVFHYGQEIFEGLKAYAWEGGQIGLFRPEMNAKRFNQSARRMCMPEVPEELFLQAIEKLVLLEKAWIPTSEGTSLYIRPTMIGVDPVLGVKPASHYYFYIILSPVGAYYPNGFNPVKIWVEDHYVRAVPGGTGEAKTGGNYASSLKAASEAKARGFDQVLWLDAKEKRYVEEVGAMNMFFVYGDRLVTAPLEGTILHGITRDSVLTLAKEMGLKIEERKIDVNDLLSGKITEAFGSGTAAVITPVGAFGYQNQLIQIGDGKTGPLAKRLYDKLTAIQCGKEKDIYGWTKTLLRSIHLQDLQRINESSLV